MSDVPFLGCKISLISKCDIRYEGILYSIDPKESTIALSKVKSMGTEDRVTGQGFIPIKDQVYDYIIFRASDVKDLRVDAPEPPGLSDPAIIQAKHSDNSGKQRNPLLLPPRTEQPISTSSQPPPSKIENNNQSTTLSGVDNKDHGNGYYRRYERRDERSHPNDRRDDRHTDRRDDRRYDRVDDRRNDRRNGDRRMDRRDNLRMDRRNEDRRPERRDDRRNDHRDIRSDYRRDDRRDDRRSDNHHRFNNASRRPPNNNYRRGPPSGPRENLKFEREYDFDKANQEFQELQDKLKNLKVAGKDSDQGDDSDSGDETNKRNSSNEEGNVVFDFYDKSKSFFDSISCEALERGQGKVNRVDWRKERQVNAETFGVVANYRRGGYRYRGPPRGPPRGPSMNNNN